MTQKKTPTLTQGLKKGLKPVWFFSCLVWIVACLAAWLWPDKVWQGEPDRSAVLAYYGVWLAFCAFLILAVIAGNYFQWRKEVGGVR